ncbi:hypothetical protein Lepto7375DRAFT_7504 [Leptolyngbya sp. PCC 7375]|nr:hypothetical protein Lepto7375DRAFT_7504 [Leptolyngbya sp. PCC 7375]
MQLLIHYQPAQSREIAFIHAWESAGKVWDLKGTKDTDGNFLFTVPDVNLSDLRDFHFKYRFSEKDWEPNTYERQLPTTDSQEVWTFDYTARCLTQAPGTNADFNQITIHVISRNKYANGQLFIWQPDTKHKTTLSLDSRDDASNISTFIVPLQDWMRNGFHFKLKTEGGDYERDRVNRVWRPSDKDNIWIKAGQLDLRSQPLELITETLDLLYPANLEQVPDLNLRDTEVNPWIWTVKSDNSKSRLTCINLRHSTLPSSTFPQIRLALNSLKTSEFSSSYIPRLKTLLFSHTLH